MMPATSVSVLPEQLVHAMMQMKRFKSAGQAQRFLAAHDGINNLFHLRRDHVTASQYRAARAQAFQTWAEVTGVAARA